MDTILIKLRLVSSCDKELLDYFGKIPIKRRAEQARRLMLVGLHGVPHVQTSQSVAAPSRITTPIESLDDHQLFASDMAALNKSLE